jgi:hypothetical protein
VAQVEGRAPVIPADGVTALPRVEVERAEDLPVGQYELTLSLQRDDEVLSRNRYPVELVKAPA